jgi:hypothetical protein
MHARHQALARSIFNIAACLENYEKRLRAFLSSLIGSSSLFPERLYTPFPLAFRVHWLKQRLNVTEFPMPRAIRLGKFANIGIVEKGVAFGDSLGCIADLKE